ncbi:MAG: glycoside hydrolase family 3 C-terminal domain-containing protein [Clostridiales bacterium]|nr:glycoside hydrolase family 3 C-terminal domain-containing protein [Clostridiales bacterium]
MKKLQTKHIVSFAVMAFILVAVLVATIICGVFNEELTALYADGGAEEVSMATLEGADDLVREIEGEGIVMLKNDGALPLSKRAINVFGWASTDAGFILSGSGSGDAGERGGGAVPTVNFLRGLTEVGFRPNTELTKIYTKFKKKKDGSGKSLEDRAEVFFKLYEPPKSVYTQAVMKQALDYSDTALIVFSRSGGEGQDLPYFQTRAQGTETATSNYDKDESRTYLQLSPQEEDLIDVVTKAGFKKVVVVINAMNVMQLGFLDNPKINAAISVGGPGQTGCISIAKVLHGTINPSGKTTDTYAYDLKTAPTYVNSGSPGVMQYNGMWADEDRPNWSDVGTSYIDYAESIYVGYKWYETADAEGYWNSQGGYDSVVQFPFGYGLSYTKFSWEVRSVSPSDGSTLTKDGKITIRVRVTNTGNRAGKDVVEVYYTPPYTSGGIEKSAVNLCAYAKTPLLEPKEHADLDLTFTVEDMKSYDCYDKNGNDNTGYELDAGKYEISLRTDAHTKASCSQNTITYKVADTIYYKADVGKNEVVNRFTGADAYSGVSIDGVTSGEGITYLTRADFAGTFPRSTKQRAKSQKVAALGLAWYEQNKVASTPQTGKSGGLKLVKDNAYNNELVMALGSNYDDPTWSDLISQLTLAELTNLVEQGGFQTVALDSIGKPRCIDLDGPAGLNFVNGSSDASFTIYPVEMVLSATWNDDLAFRMGQTVGLEAQEARVSGWYAPGANIHRSPFDGRNFEYYSEDSFLSGKMCANEVYGCLTKGLYPYMKHFVANETERQRTSLNTWLTEQALREIYLRPFEIAVKEGHANAIMTSFNCIGAVWTGGNRALLEDLARGEWGFNGTMLTDWSSGGDFMNIDQGLACGQDIWLNGPGGGVSGHNRKNSADGIADMQRAAKNIVYTYCNTYYIAQTAGDGMSLKLVEEGEPLWLAILIPLDVVALAGVGVWLFFTIRSIKKGNATATVGADSLSADTSDASGEATETMETSGASDASGVSGEAEAESPAADESPTDTAEENSPIEAAEEDKKEKTDGAVCHNCGAKLNKTSKFCYKCGIKVRGDGE